MERLIYDIAQIHSLDVSERASAIQRRIILASIHTALSLFRQQSILECILLIRLVQRQHGEYPCHRRHHAGGGS